MKNNRIYLLLILIISLILLSCNDKKKTTEVETTPKETVVKIEEMKPAIADVDAAFKLQITAIYDTYNTLKDALVASTLLHL